MRLALVVAVGLALAAPAHATVRTYGSGADKVWLFFPTGGAPRSLVLFVHGHGGPGETTPKYHRPWLEHLAREGSVVVYPHYEEVPGDPAALTHIVRGMRTAVRHVPRGLPFVGIGYSRGGALVVEYAAVARPPLPKPDGILSVFAGSSETPRTISFATVPKRTHVVVLAGDRDEVVGRRGPAGLILRLAQGRFPTEHLQVEVVRSRGSFVASHLSPLETSPAAKRAFWARADRLIAFVRRR